MAAYKRLMLSFKYELVALESLSAFQREAVSLRERQVDVLTAIKRTPLALLMLLVGQRDELAKTRGKMTTDKVLQWFEQCHWARSSERPTKTLLDNAFALWNKLTKEPSLLRVLQDAERLYGSESPFQSIAQIYLVTTAIKKVETSKLLWIFESILDSRKEEQLTNDEIAKNRLSSGNVTVVDVYAYKQDVLHELLGTVLSALPSISASDLSKIRESCGSHGAFRKAFGQDGGLKSWRSQLPSQGCKFLDLVEQCIFNKLHDTCLRQCLKMSKVPADAVRYGSLGGAIQAIHDDANAQQVASEDAVVVAASTIEIKEGEEVAEPADGDDEKARLDEETMEALQRWKQAARSEVDKHCEFLVRPTSSSMDLMCAMLANSYKGHVLQENQYHLHVYDSKTEGESKSQPSLRCWV